MTLNAIEVNNLSKVYRLYDHPTGRLKEAVFKGRRKYHRENRVLRDISFTIRRGNTVGIIGRNGSGKSTLLQLIAKILTPTEGSITVDGRISALLELGSGFDPDFTGRENVYLNGAILGLSESEIDRRFADIEAFADIGSYIDQPVKLYSSGMYLRLGFATAVNVDPDILLVDEALAVGDIVFQHRCMHKIREFQESGKTILFVSHDAGAVRKLCTEAILLDKGRIACMGDPEKVIQAYNRAVWGDNPAAAPEMGRVLSTSSGKRPLNVDAFEPITRCDNRFGNKNGEIVAFCFVDEAGEKIETVEVDQKLNVSILVKCHEHIEMPIAGFVLRDLLGNDLIMTNTDAEGCYLGPCPRGSLVQITFSFTMPRLKTGSYAISAAFGSGTIDNHNIDDWIENIAVFSYEPTEQFFGMMQVNVEINLEFRSDDSM